MAFGDAALGGLEELRQQRRAHADDGALQSGGDEGWAGVGFGWHWWGGTWKSNFPGLLKGCILQPFETCCFSTKIKGNHHLQDNVQVYNARIPVSF